MNNVRLIYTVFLLVITVSCIKQTDNSIHFDLLEPDNIIDENIEIFIDKCPEKRFSRDSSLKTINFLKQIYKQKQIERGRELTEGTMYKITVINSQEKYRIVINYTTNNRIVFNYFKNVKKSYYQYFGRSYVEKKQFKTLDSIIKNLCK